MTGASARVDAANRPPRSAVRATVRAVLAEFGKLVSLRSPVLCHVAVAPTAVVVAFALGNDAARASDVPVPPLGPASDAVQVALLVLAAAAMLLVTSEYQGGTVATTFIAEPRRAVVVLAKAIVSAVVGAVVIAIAGGAAVIGAVLGTTTSADAVTVSSFVARAVLVGAVVGPLVTGLGFALRRSVGVLVVAVVVLVGGLALPDVTGRWTAAGGISAFLAGSDVLYPAVVGFAVLATWAAAAITAGLLVVASRDV